MKSLKIYLDTSIINYIFADDEPARRQITIELFREIQKGKFDVYISELVLIEINRCAQPKRDKLLQAIGSIESMELKITDNAQELAKEYLRYKVVPQKYFEDAMHIALASLNNMSALVSWNFKHMVKLNTIIKVNEINKRLGLATIEIVSPEEVI